LRAIAAHRHERDDEESEESQHFHRRLDHQLCPEKEPEELQPVMEADSWSAEVDNAWTNFSEILQKTGLQQGVEIEVFVRNRRALWVAMDAEKRDRYNQGKIERFVQQKDPHQILLRDLIMSTQCLHIPHSHYACPICWHTLTVHREASAEAMRKHCFHAHNLPAYRCHDPITLTLRQMVAKTSCLQQSLTTKDIQTRLLLKEIISNAITSVASIEL
jgi:hypothetical protein